MKIKCSKLNPIKGDVKKLTLSGVTSSYRPLQGAPPGERASPSLSYESPLSPDPSDHAQVNAGNITAGIVWLNTFKLSNHIIGIRGFHRHPRSRSEVSTTQLVRHNEQSHMCCSVAFIIYMNSQMIGIPSTDLQSQIKNN